jgi:nicotinate-nucleotide pyrophosphorylase (carboxylating)
MNEGSSRCPWNVPLKTAQAIMTPATEPNSPRGGFARYLPPSHLIAAQIRTALEEDVGAGDLTASLLPVEQPATVELITRQEAVVCGCAWFNEVFRQLDPQVRVEWLAADGERVRAGQLLGRLQGPARTLLTGERTAINYLQTLSGTASRARRYADAVAGLPVRVLDTRKTIPGLRLQQKYAVLCGGCHNHRKGLYDAILIKENHILAAGSIAAAMAAARTAANGAPIEIEVESLAQVDEALAAGACHLLLDNFELADLKGAVALTAGRARLEASGGITLERIRAVAETGVDEISVGDLTKDLVAVDLSMRFVNS